MSRRTQVAVATGFAAVILAACSVQRVQPGSANVALDEHSAHMNPADRSAPVTMGAAQPGAQGYAGIPASNATAAARVAASPRHGEWVKIPMQGTDTLMAWVVYPKSANARAKAPVVVVVHEIFGLSTWVRGVADQVAADGFIAIAPDFLSRVRGGPSSVELSSDTARRLIAGVNAEEKNRIIAAAANYAMMQPSAEQRYGVIGYCWGGTAVWGHAVNGGVKGFGGGVAFYGSPYMTQGRPATATEAAVPATVSADSLRKITKPVMLLNGSKDARIGAAMPAIDSIMKANRKEYSGTNYEGAIHGFLRAQDDARPARAANATTNTPAESEEAVNAERAANLAAAKDGWPKTIAFLKKNLGVK